MLQKILRVIDEEGIQDIFLRIKKRTSDIYLEKKYRLSKRLGFKSIKSQYGINLTANYDDATFKFYYRAAYGYFYWNKLENRTNSFTFIDIGANQGLYSICAAKNSNCSQVYAFEPIKNTFNLLKKNVELNKVHGKCSLHKKAISNTTSTKKISINNTHSGAASLAEREQSYFNNSESIDTIDSKNLNSILQLVKNSIIIKVDVEGHEPTVIQELLKTDFIDQVIEMFYEVDTNWIDPSKIENMLRNKGFNEFQKVGADNVHYDVLASKS